MLFFTNISYFFLAVISIISVIQIYGLGTFGLVVYGILIFYSIAFIAINIRKIKIYMHPIFYVACAYYLYFIFAGFINGNYNYTGPTLFQYFMLTVIAFSIRPISELRQDFIYISKLMTVMGLVISIGSLTISLITYYCPDAILFLPKYIGDLFVHFTGAFPDRATGMIGNANTTGGYLNYSALFSMYIVVSTKSNKWRIISIINILFAIFSIFILLASRTSMLGLLLVGSMFFILVTCFSTNVRMKKVLAKLLVYIFISGFVFLIACIFIEDLRSFLLNRVLRISSLSDGSGRLDIYKTAFELGSEHRLFGFYHKELVETTGVYNAHNIFLEALSFGGIPCLILFCVYFFYTIIIASKNAFTKSQINNEYRIFFCFLFCYLCCYLIRGFTECDLNKMRMGSLCVQLVMGYTHIINYQLKQALPKCGMHPTK